MESYVVERRIGAGAFGIVLQARHALTGDRVALKRVPLPLESMTRAPGFHELQTLRLIQHPNVVTLLDYFPYESDLVLVMELCRCDLARLLKYTTLSLDECRICIRHVLRGLDELHRHGLVHRDVKTSNVLISQQGVCKLADFGLSTVQRRPLTPYVSTRWYRAPEVLLGSPEYTSAVDMWGAGLILYELLTGAPLLPGQGDIEQYVRLVHMFGPVRYPGCDRLPDLHKLEVVQLAGSHVAGEPGAPASGADGGGGGASDAADAAAAAAVSEAPARPQLDVALHGVPPTAAQLLRRMLEMDPARRITAAEALRHPFVAAPACAPGDACDRLSVSRLVS